MTLDPSEFNRREAEHIHPVCLLLGGPTYLISVRGRIVPFELHPYCGPNPVHKITGEPLIHIPPGFWDAIERWEKGGSKRDGDICLVPEWCRACDGRGDEIKHIDGKHWEVVGKCERCDGTGLLAKAN